MIKYLLDCHCHFACPNWIAVVEDPLELAWLGKGKKKAMDNVKDVQERTPLRGGSFARIRKT